MVFSSMTFLFAFLPALLAVYFIVPPGKRNLRNGVLLLFSLLFYSCGGLRLLPILLSTVLLDYLFGRLASQGRSPRVRKAAVWGAVLFGVGLLVWYKYIGFLTESLHALGLGIPVLKAVLPIGISFYTFAGLSYVIDVYRGEAKEEPNLLRLALYISLFPQLMAGPIVRYGAVAADLAGRKESLEHFSHGGMRFLFGLAKKMLLANQLAQIADAAFGKPAGGLSVGLAWLGAAAYTGQIYFDFSGYSDMAIGLAELFGFRYPENFNYPYISRSVTEFWRRWHISLSTWFRDYVYIPLGGNRVSRAKQVRNLLVVWLLTGLWHGAAWNFPAWGLYYALLLIGERYLWGRALDRAPAVLRHAYALVIITAGWVIFRSVGLGQAVSYLGVMFGGVRAALWDAQVTYCLMEFRWELVIAVVAATPVKAWAEAFLKARADKQVWASFLVTWGASLLALCLGFLSLMRLAQSGFTPFIYYQF